MADKRSEGIKGAVEDLKGRVKETAGTLFGNDEKAREGRAQREKGESQQDVAEKLTQAEQSQRDARAAEQQERFHRPDDKTR